jgi:hypothetical protein
MEYNKIDDDETEFAEAWRPADGDNVEGVITEIVTIKGKFGDYPCITIVQDNTERVAIHAAPSVLKQQVNGLVNKHGMKIGDRFGAKYEGKKTSKEGGREYHDYTVAWEAAKPATGGSIKEQIYIVGETPAAASTKPVDTFDVDNF